MIVFTPTANGTSESPVEPILLTRSEAARMLRICLRKLDYLVKRDEIPVVRIDKSVRFYIDDLKQFVESMKSNKAAIVQPFAEKTDDYYPSKTN